MEIEKIFKLIIVTIVVGYLIFTVCFLLHLGKYKQGEVLTLDNTKKTVNIQNVDNTNTNTEKQSISSHFAECYISNPLLILSVVGGSLILAQIALIILAIIWLNKIRSTCNSINIANNLFSSIYSKAQEEVSSLYKKIIELADNTAKKEHHMLHTVFHLEDIEANLKILINEFRIFAKSSNIVSKAQE